MRLRVGLLSLLLLAPPLAARAEPAHREPTRAPAELDARMTALSRIEPLDVSVARPLALARAALERASTRRGAGDDPGAARAEAIALAAVELAEARLRLLRERALYKATEARRRAASDEQSQAERALERERARLTKLEQEAARP